MKNRIEASDKGFIANLFRIKQPDGNYKWKEMSIMVIPGSAGKEYLVCGKATADDAQHYFANNNRAFNPEDYGITAENDVFQSKMWESIVASSAIKFFWKDKNRRFLGGSKAFLDFFNVKLDDIIGKKDAEMGWLIDEKAFEEGELEVVNKGKFILKLPDNVLSME